jgi:hypothetical protein
MTLNFEQETGMVIATNNMPVWDNPGGEKAIAESYPSNVLINSAIFFCHGNLTNFRT